tara:strand:+ start:178 stop:345 length:168 start_codon:yes stop_codon:yes gene_type:complete
VVVREAVERAMAEAVTEPVERAASVGDWLFSTSSNIGFFICIVITLIVNEPASTP